MNGNNEKLVNLVQEGIKEKCCWNFTLRISLLAALVTSVIILLVAWGVVVLATSRLAVLTSSLHTVLSLPITIVALILVPSILLILILIVTSRSDWRIHIIFVRCGVFSIVLIWSLVSRLNSLSLLTSVDWMALVLVLVPSWCLLLPETLGTYASDTTLPLRPHILVLHLGPRAVVWRLMVHWLVAASVVACRWLPVHVGIWRGTAIGWEASLHLRVPLILRWLWSVCCTWIILHHPTTVVIPLWLITSPHLRLVVLLIVAASSLVALVLVISIDELKNQIFGYLLFALWSNDLDNSCELTWGLRLCLWIWILLWHEYLRVTFKSYVL